MYKHRPIEALFKNSPVTVCHHPKVRDSYSYFMHGLSDVSLQLVTMVDMNAQHRAHRYLLHFGIYR